MNGVSPVAEQDGDGQHVTKTTLATKVADALVAYILEEGLKKGALLPATADLADRYGVSRTVVREAIADLAGRGLLQRGQGRETVVLLPGSEQLHGLLQFRALSDGVTPEQVLETRRAIEGITARLAAERRDEAELDEMKAALDAMRAARNDTEYHDADIRFHHLLAVAAENPLILLIFEGIESLARELRIRATLSRRAQGESFEPIHAAHRAIYNAVLQRDPGRAERAMLAHLRQSQAALKSLRTPPKGTTRKAAAARTKPGAAARGRR